MISSETIAEKTAVTLLTDFGLRDPYVAEMKAVILSICPGATLVDITHEIPKYDVTMGAYLLAQSVAYFTGRTVHLAVVDPGVGGGRKPIAIETRSAILIGPDNGLLIPAAEKLGLEHVYHIENPLYPPSKISRTFHGRDIFAPAAGHLARGMSPTDLGREISNYRKISFPKPKIARGKITGEVLYIDSFGSIVTNITAELLEQADVKYGTPLKVAWGNIRPKKVRFLETYSRAQTGALLATVGGSGFMEISANMADAAKKFKVRRGMRVTVSV